MYLMADNSRSLAEFTNQYQMSKTLRFELKPVGQTAEWIKKHNIIGIENGEPVGMDADRAKNYKYAKLLLDELHCQFIADALQLDHEVESTKKLNAKIIELYSASEILATNLPGNIFKYILDEKANEWVTLFQHQMPQYWRDDINELKNKIASEADKKEIKHLESIVTKLNNLCETGYPFKNTGIEILYGSHEDLLKLLEWAVRCGRIRPSFKDLQQGNSTAAMPVEHVISYIRSFDSFCTYFTGFNKNRANVYDVTGKKSTSLVHRICMQNMQFHFNNIRKWETVTRALEKYAKDFTGKTSSWRAMLAEYERNLAFAVEDVLTPAAFIAFINQSGIDRYNEIINGRAGDSGKTRVPGLNEFISRACQQFGAKHHEFPLLQSFYKQILSKSDKTFTAAFETDKEMFDQIRDFHQSIFVEQEIGKPPVIQELIENIRRLTAESPDEKSNIFISKNKLPRISTKLTGAWNTINNRLRSELGEKDFNKMNCFPVQLIDDALNAVVGGEQFSFKEQHIKAEYLSDSGHILFDFLTKRLDQLLLSVVSRWNKLAESGVLTAEKLDSANGKKGLEQIAAIKAFLDCSLEFQGFIGDWLLPGKKPSAGINNVWDETLQGFCDQFPIVKLYKMTRNHVTRKAYSSKKVKINFNNCKLLNGWDRNKESINGGILFEQDGLYFLGIMPPAANNIFDYAIADTDSEKKKQTKRDLAEKVLSSLGEPSFRKMIYKFLPGPNKMLPRVLFAESNVRYFKPSREIINIKEKKLYIKSEIEKNGIQNLYDYIDFCKQSLCIHPEWSKEFGFSEGTFRATAEYHSVDEFYKDVEMRGYKISFDNIKKSYIDEKVANGELYLFQIYSKDFSQRKKGSGNDNLHTSYWKLLFDPENLQDVVLKLNGQAEIFFRKASVALTGSQKAKGHHYNELKNKFSYPIIKDRRFTEDKFFFHCPVDLNFKAPSVPSRFNDKIKTFLRNNPAVNILGLDRGETHLLYYTITDRNGNILDHGSFDTIAAGERNIDYHAILDTRTENLEKVRESWSEAASIKGFKAGYLSQVLHKITQLIVQYNAIVVLENLNRGFKRDRYKIEKMEYKQFEKALIEKLNYLAFKNKKSRLEAGHYLNAYQLANKFESSEKAGIQNGILFYAVASYAAMTDPVTGFIKNVYAAYESVEKCLKLWASFDSIIYNPARDRFEFTYTLGKIAGNGMYTRKDEDKITKRQWTLCSCVVRTRYAITALDRDGEGKQEIYCVTDELKKMFENAKVDYRGNPDIGMALLGRQQRTDAALHQACLYFFNAIMNIRVTDRAKASQADEYSFIHSPVEPFFDSRQAWKNMPASSDANGAYNMARTGIRMLLEIDKHASAVDLATTKLDWQEYAQSAAVVKAQTAKLHK